MSDWQPIETAPKNGGLVLLALRNGEVIIGPAEWADTSTAEKAALYKREGAWPDAGYTPTHWMPLPQPPEEGRT